MEKKSNFCEECGGALDKFGRKLPVLQPDGFPIATLATDAIVIRGTNPNPRLNEVLLIRRGKEGDPYKGMWAFPGGKVEYGEDPPLGCLRELKEECDLQIKAGMQPKVLGVYGDPNRDIRTHTVSIVYVVPVEPAAVPKAGDDAAAAQFFVIEEALKAPEKLAFDHAKILQDYLNKHAEL